MTGRSAKPARVALAWVAVLCTLALAPGSAAKGPIALEICGQTGCTILDDQHNRQLLSSVLAVSEARFDDYVSAPPLAPYYDLRLDAHWGESLDSYVPFAAVVKSGSNWIRVDPALAVRFDALLRDIPPFPPPELTRALVGGRAGADPSLYAAIFDPLPDAELPLDTQRIEIVLEASRPSPWTTRESVAYFAGAGVISRDGGWFALPPSLADTVEADSGTAATTSKPPPPEPAPPRSPDSDAVPAVGPVGSPAPGNGFPWAAVAGAAGGLVALLLAGAVALRSAPRSPRTRPS